MRRRDVAALSSSFALALAGVLVLPWGAAAEPSVDPVESGASAAPSATGAPEPSAAPSPSVSVAPSPSAFPSASADPEVRGVSDAVFTWSINQQSNAQSHNPITDNYFSAGAANPGRGGMVLTKSKWKAAEGNVAIQKRTTSGAWKTATWAGLGTDATGAKIGLYGPFSGHRIQISKGTGVLDPANDDATLQWKGTFTVVYYGGNTVFTLTDPKITVRKGVGQMTATAGGWSSDRFDPTVWKPVEPSVVPVAELRDVDVTQTGLKVTPEYEGVEVTGPEKQLRTGESWGSFPQEFVSFIEPMGASQFWYSTGLQSDWTKLPEPISVGWEGAAPVDVPTQPPSGNDSAGPSNPVVTAPTPTVPTPAAPQVAPPATVPAPGLVPSPEQAPLMPGSAPVQVTATSPDHLVLSSSATSNPSSTWVLGGLLLLAAALLLLVPATPFRRR